MQEILDFRNKKLKETRTCKSKYQNLSGIRSA